MWDMSIRRKSKLAIITIAHMACAAIGFAPSSNAATTANPSAADIISQINQYRAQKGLPAYKVNSSLMSSAQAQSDHQAAMNSVTHTGPGGSRPRDRAYAAGYGGGSTIWISEIIYGGSQATVTKAMSWWKGSQVHNDTMLSTRYVDIGAGVATAGGKTYFTAVMAVVAGGSWENSGEDSLSEPSNTVPVAPVVRATAHADGSIVHEVQPGQTLWTIAAVYEVPLDTILSLNDLSDSTVVYPGQEILVRPSHTPEPAGVQEDDAGETNPDPTSTGESPSVPPKARSSATPRPALAQAGEPGRTSHDPSRPSPRNTEDRGNSVGSIALGMLALYTLIAVLMFALRGGEEPDQSI
jgi:uncharacterized protein YkwD